MGAERQKAVRALNYLFEGFLIAQSVSPACASAGYYKKKVKI